MTAPVQPPPDMNGSIGTADLKAVGERLRAQRGPRYWRSLDELARTEQFVQFLQREFPERASEWLEGFNRRGFLKMLGASLALAGLTACTRQPIERIVPYIRQPEEIIPGKPLFFATAMTLNGYATGLLVESHDGHPTKIEGNPLHPMSLGASNVFHQASLLDLYDPDRSKVVMNGLEVATWEQFLSTLNDQLNVLQKKHGAGLYFLTEPTTSPTLTGQIQALLKKFPAALWHQYDPLSRENESEGIRLAFGESLTPHYHFERAKAVLALDSDFMFLHPAGLRHAHDFADRRRKGRDAGDMNRFYSIESSPTVTGSNADHRLPMRSCEIEGFLRNLASQFGVLPNTSPAAFEQQHDWISALVQDLRVSRGAGIVIAGENQPAAVHALVHSLNHALGNVGATVSYTGSVATETKSHLSSITELTNDLLAGRVDLLLIVGGNPVFDVPADLDFARALTKARLRIHLSSEANETSAACHWHIPRNHYLESWSDARAYDGTISLVQPLILPLYAGKSTHELLDAMLQLPGRDDYEIVREHWRLEHSASDFEKLWRQALHDGLIANTALSAKEVKARPLQLPPLRTASVNLEINFRPDPSILDGCFANNGWLQELPKPITKLAWDNAAFISPALAQRRKLANGQMLKVSFRGHAMAIPVWIVPGHADNSITLPLGYGRTVAGRIGVDTGFDAYRLRDSVAFWFGTGAEISVLGGHYQLVATQNHHTIDSEERQVMRETTLREFLHSPNAVREHSEVPPRNDTLFKAREHDYDGYRWGMSIDLTTCIGCNACILACQSENNIPVVGKAQVGRGREMHWLRVDTYFSGPPENPVISYQPVPCMHCETAPCELVCPVEATLHDHEGLNVQVYNRCIGTRYCSNNCPYKVRRFNFLQYADLNTGSYVPMRNPNVSVRWRGVMEKCTYCIQRISSARIASKIEDRRIRDGEIRTACQQACPAEAIIFGDLSDSRSRVAVLKKHPLDFPMLGQLNTRPRTTYLARLKNPNSTGEMVPQENQTTSVIATTSPSNSKDAAHD